MPRGRPKNVPQRVYDEIVAPVQRPDIGRVVDYLDAAHQPKPLDRALYATIVAAFCGNPNIMAQSGVLKPEYYPLAKDIARRIHEEGAKP